MVGSTLNGPAEVDGKHSQSPYPTVISSDKAERELGAQDNVTPVVGGEGEYAVPEDKKVESLEDAEDDWAHDPENPRNWRLRKKWLVVTIVSAYTFLSPLGSSMMAPALPLISDRYNIESPTIQAMSLSIYLLTFAIGPMLFAPVSEIYGRTWVYHLNNLAALGFTIGCAYAPSTSTFIAFRLLCGFFGSVPLSIGGGSISDLFSERDRASAMSIYTLGPLLGPAFGPVAGGFIAEAVGVKYIFIVIACLCGLIALFGIPFLKETYHPVLRARKALRIALADQETGVRLPVVRGRSWRSVLADMGRPFVLLTRSFVCFLLSLYMALQYGIYYLMFSTFPNLFSTIYGFSIGAGGLAYLGLGLGFIASTVVGATIADKIYQTLAERNGGRGKPEMRIPALIFGSLFVPIGLFWYGWSAQAGVQWIMPIIGTGIFGFGLMATFLPIQLYLVDTFTYAASAMSAASAFRSLLGFAFPLFGEQMYSALGYGGGNSLLAGLAIVIGIPFPIWLWFYGERVRQRSPLSR